MPIEDDLVPNPEYLDLQAALATVREHAHTLETSLDQACALFGGHPVWVGPAARAFGEELNGRRLRLKATVQRVLAELEADLRATPSKVSPGAIRADSLWPTGR